MIYDWIELIRFDCVRRNAVGPSGDRFGNAGTKVSHWYRSLSKVAGAGSLSCSYFFFFFSFSLFHIHYLLFNTIQCWCIHVLLSSTNQKEWNAASLLICIMGVSMGDVIARRHLLMIDFIDLIHCSMNWFQGVGVGAAHAPPRGLSGSSRSAGSAQTFLRLL